MNSSQTEPDLDAAFIERERNRFAGRARCRQDNDLPERSSQCLVHVRALRRRGRVGIFRRRDCPARRNRKDADEYDARPYAGKHGGADLCPERNSHRSI